MPNMISDETFIRPFKVNGTHVYNSDGSLIAFVEDLVLDETSNEVKFAVLGLGGILNMGEQFHPVPWEMLSYDGGRQGYVIQVSKNDLKSAPSLDVNSLDVYNGEIYRSAYVYYDAIVN